MGTFCPLVVQNELHTLGEASHMEGTCCEQGWYGGSETGPKLGLMIIGFQDRGCSVHWDENQRIAPNVCKIFC